MTRKITILIKEPGREWHPAEVEDTLETYQKIVGGYIEGFYTNYKGLHFFCNEEGKLRDDCKPNIICGNDLICGTIFAVRDDEEGEFAPITAEDILDLTGRSLQ